MQTEGALLRLPSLRLLARPSPLWAELGAEGTGADPQGHYSTTTPAPPSARAPRDKSYGVLHTSPSRRAQHSL